MSASPDWGYHLAEQTTAVGITDGHSYRMKDAKRRKENPQANLRTTTRGGYFYLATRGYFNLAIDTRLALAGVSAFLACEGLA